MDIIYKLIIPALQDVISINIRTDGITVVMTVALNVEIARVPRSHRVQIVAQPNISCQIRLEGIVSLTVPHNIMLRQAQIASHVTERVKLATA